MEEEVKKPDLPRKKRRTSLFKRRKRAEIRPFVKEHKKKKHSKMIQLLFLFVLCIFLITGFVFLIKIYVLPIVFNQNPQLANPLGTQPPTKSQVESVLREENIDASEVKVVNGILTFVYNKKIFVTMALKKDIKEQLDLVEAIDRQITFDGKQAISIDLRYNKPIVKF